MSPPQSFFQLVANASFPQTAADFWIFLSKELANQSLLYISQELVGAVEIQPIINRF